MPNLSKIPAAQRSQLYHRIGSFWLDLFGDQDQIRTIIDATTRTPFGDTVRFLADMLSGQIDEGKVRRYVEVPFRKQSVFESGRLLYDDPDEEQTFLDVSDYVSVYGTNQIRYYVVPLSSILPYQIQAGDEALVLGVDFFVHTDWIYFRRDPRTLFEGGYYLVTAGLDLSRRTYMTQFTGVRAGNQEKWVVDFLRRSQTPNAYMLAMAAVAGLGIVEFGGAVQNVTELPSGGAIYIFPSERVVADYAHERLTVGTVVKPRSVIGDAIRMIQKDDSGNAWWRQIDWHGGMVLDPLIPGFHGLKLVDKDTIAYCAGQDDGSVAGSKVHARLILTENFFNEKPYWDYVSSLETRSGHYLNGLLGLPEEIDGGDPAVADTFQKLLDANAAANVLNAELGLPQEQPTPAALPNTQVVNALDTFFRAVFDESAFVLAIQQGQIPHVDQLFDFIARERLVGMTPIIISFLGYHPSDTLTVGENFQVMDSVVVTDELAVTVSESLGLESMMIEGVKISGASYV